MATMELEVRIVKWLMSVPQEVRRICDGISGFYEISGLEAMAYSLLEDSFEPMTCIVVEEVEHPHRFERLYFMAGIKRDNPPVRGWCRCGDVKITYNLAAGVDYVKELRTCIHLLEQEKSKKNE